MPNVPPGGLGTVAASVPNVQLYTDYELQSCHGHNQTIGYLSITTPLIR